MQANRTYVTSHDREKTCASCNEKVSRYKELLVLNLNDKLYTICLECAMKTLLNVYEAAWREAEDTAKIDPQEPLSRIQQSLEVHGAMHRERRAETYGQKIDKRIEAIEAGLIQ